MVETTWRRLICVLLPVVLLSACASSGGAVRAGDTQQERQSDPSDPAENTGRGGTADPAPRNAGAVALETRATSEFSAGDYDRAAATLERAIRIDPRDPGLWVDLGKVRLAQGRPDLAESLAIKAQSLAGSNRVVEEEAQDLAARARAAQ